MTNQHSEQTGRPSRRHRCEEQMRSGVRLLVENACVQGFTREEALIAISDAADAELADLTESFADGPAFARTSSRSPGSGIERKARTRLLIAADIKETRRPIVNEPSTLLR